MAEQPAAPRRILVIDDNRAIHADFLKVLAPDADAGAASAKAELDLLEAGLFDTAAAPEARTGVAVDSAYQGEEGLALVMAARAAGRPYAVAFVDMRMPPGWDGLETTGRLLAADPFLQIVICTAYSDYSWSQMTERLGASDRVLILKKPFDNIEVLQLAQSLSEKWDLVQAAHARKQSLEQLVEERTRELAATHAKLNALIEASPVGIIASDSQGRVTTWNPAAQRTFGWSIEEVVERDRLAAMSTDLRDELDRLIQGWLASNGCSGLELRVTCKDGSEIEVSLSTAVLRDALGHVDGLVTIVNDITTRKRVEVELRRAKQAAEEAAKAKSDFLANMSHEIRTPMNGVIGMTDLLLSTELTSEQREFATTVNSCGEALLTLINDILDFSKIEAGKLDMESIPFSPRSLVEETVHLLAERAQAKKLDLWCLIGASLPERLVGDPTRLRQVLLNLLSNAIKFTTAGEVSVTAEVTALDGERALLRLAVGDTGIGLDDHAKSRLFQEFSQGDTSTSRTYGGTGLGLAISKRLIGLMGGTIAVDSEPGRGSVFTCSIPLRIAAPETGAATPSIDLAGRRALCIDAGSGSRRSLGAQLRAWGMRCDEASDEASALAALAGGDLPDLIIIDSNLPGLGGIEMAAALRASIAPRSRPMVLLTTIGQRGMAASASAAGVSGFLTKPIRQGQLRDCLRTVLDLGAAAPAAALVTRHSLAEASAATRCRVLLADDSQVNQRVISMQLARLGCQVDVAHNGIEAVAAAARNAYDVIFMDCSMPEMDGFSATRAIRAREGTALRTPIFALTAGAFAGDRERCLEAGMDDLVPKPVNMEILDGVLKRIDGKGSAPRTKA
jgi:two-component system sensor histidine kinase/response regulator